MRFFGGLVARSCPTLCDSPPGSPVHGILQARILEWAAIPFPRDLPDPGIEPGSPALQADSLLTEPPGSLVGVYPCFCWTFAQEWNGWLTSVCI